MKKSLNLIFPHQLFAESPLLQNGHQVYLIEAYLFFKQYQFHKQKIAFHRATMQAYKTYLQARGIEVHYITAQEAESDVQVLMQQLAQHDVEAIYFIDPADNWLEKRIRNFAGRIKIHQFDSPQFLNTKEALTTFFRPEKKSFFQTTFYKQQRKRLNILLDEHQNPVGGKWTYDTENRKKYPKSKTPPPIYFPESSALWQEAVDYVELHFTENPGKVSSRPIYPLTYEEASNWMHQFFDFRFYDFGIYEDAIVSHATFLNHSILTPVLNVGLLLPEQLLQESLTFAEQNDIPLNSTEGFVRQIIGWREFIRGM